MSGYPYSATGFPSNLQIGVAAAADSGMANLRATTDIFQSRSVEPAALLSDSRLNAIARIRTSTPNRRGSHNHPRVGAQVNPTSAVVKHPALWLRSEVDGMMSA